MWNLAAVILAVIGIVMTWRTRRPKAISFASHELEIVGADAVLPNGFEIRHDGKPVPRITRSMVWIWNSGKQTVRRRDIVADDPLRLDYTGDILDVRLKHVSRDVLRIKAKSSKKTVGIVSWSFDFLDSGDGCILEVFHCGAAQPPKCRGTIRELPEGITRRVINPVIARRTKFDRWILGFIGIWSLGTAARAVLNEQQLGNLVPYSILTLFEVESWIPSWLVVTIGFLMAFVCFLLVWQSRNRLPPSLAVNGKVDLSNR